MYKKLCVQLLVLLLIITMIPSKIVAEEGHTHSDGCYASAGDLLCGLEESERHVHTTDCYAKGGELLCDQVTTQPSGAEDTSKDEEKAVEKPARTGELSLSFDGAVEATLRDIGSTAVFRFDCPETGAYTVAFMPKGMDPNVYTVYPDVRYSFYEGNADGTFDETKKPIVTEQTIYGGGFSQISNQWLEGGKTYYLQLENLGYDPYDLENWDESWLGPKPTDNEITLETYVAYTTLNFRITNSADSDAAADATLLFDTWQTYVYTEEFMADLEERRQNPEQASDMPLYRNEDRAQLSLAPGESIDMMVFMSKQSDLSWQLLPKYGSGYQTDSMSGSLSQWDGKPGHETIELTLEKKRTTDDGKVTFRSIADLTEIVSGHQYIFAIEENGAYYALAYDGNHFISPIELTPTTLQNGEGEDYEGYTVDVSNRDVEQGDFILTSSSAGTVSPNEATDLKFYTNYKNNAGKKIYLKGGASKSGRYHTMFSTSSGVIKIITQPDHPNRYRITHDKFGCVKFRLDATSGEPMFDWRPGQTGNTNVIILTNAPVVKQDDPEGEQEFVRVSPFMLTKQTDVPIVFAHQVGDTYYALTTDGAKEVPTPEGNGGSAIMKTDFANAWKPMSAMGQKNHYEENFGISYYTFSGLRQGKQFLNPISSDSAIEIHLIHNYRQGKWNTSGYYYFSDGDKAVISDTDNQHFIGWDETTKTFVWTDDIRQAVHMELYSYRPTYTYETYYPVYDLTHIEEWEKILITYDDNNGHSGIIVPGKGMHGLGLDPIGADSQSGEPVYYENGDSTIKALSNYGITLGALKNSSKQKYKLSALRWNDLGQTLYVDGYKKYKNFLATDDKECMLTYADGTEDTIVLRGSKQWLSYDGKQGEFVGATSQEEASTIQIWSINPPTEQTTTIHFHDDNKAIEKTRHTNETVALPKKEDVEKDGYTYSFVGWSIDPDQKPYLSLEESCDLYDYDDVIHIGGIKPSIAQSMHLIGHCNPEETDSINPKEHANDGKLDLYPVYAVKGFSSTVTADDNGTPIVGISDWKDLEPTSDTDVAELEKEKWLGKIYCTIYKDGELWGDEKRPMFFRYHNDDAADVNLKFISDQLLGQQKYQDAEDPMYAYVSDPEAYPLTSQTGNYVIEAVYASQGGSEDGLKYNYNWLTEHGGQLDNIEGGSTIIIYVTTTYQVEYYLDDVLLEDDTWNNPNFYTTPGTENTFTKKAKDASYYVEMGNEYQTLMDHSIADNSTFVDEKLKRGEYTWFAYHMVDYEHVMDLAVLPKAPKDRVLTSSVWSMENQDRNKLANLAPQSKYAVSGTVYGTGNTKHAWKDADDTVPTYHLYAYTKATPDTPDPITATVSVSKNWQDEGNETRPASVFVQLYRDGAAYGDKVELSDENGWQYTWINLDPAYHWTVDEPQVPSGYESHVSHQDDIWTITNTAKPNQPDTPDTPKLPATGQLWWPVWLLFAMGLMFVGSGLRRWKASDDEE